MTYRKLTRDEHFQLPGPKRILALDGGGLRGMLTLGFLARIETLLRERHGNDPSFRLCHYFDLIAGTSTGAIIAAALACGMSVDDLVTHYMSMGRNVFKRSWFRRGIIRARYDETKLNKHLKQVLGEETTLGSNALKTGLLIMTKRMDTGSPWPLGNNPRGAYFRAPEGADWISNGDYPLWQVVRASAAAPTFFDPEKITLSEQPGRTPVRGDFVDGGVSPFNNPSLQAFMYATLDGFRVRWTTGPEALQLVSLGTGSVDPGSTPAKLAAEGALKALLSLMDDCSALVETMMQWLSSSRTARSIDDEIGDLSQDLMASGPLFTYLRYDLALTRDSIDPLKPALSDDVIASLSEMDEPDNLETLKELGELAAARQVQAEDFSATFDLPPDEGRPLARRREYLKKGTEFVVAVQLDLATSGFRYEKWGGTQTCKPGDWLVNNNGEVYTVDRDTFARTYRPEGPGVYVKTTPVWAEVTERDGHISTQEGVTHYKAGDYIVYNDPEGTDGYAVSAGSFVEMYEPTRHRSEE